MKFNDLFKNQKPLIGMIHTNSSHACITLELVKKEIEIYLKYGIHPLIENYFGLASDCEDVPKTRIGAMGVDVFLSTDRFPHSCHSILYVKPL